MDQNTPRKRGGADRWAFIVLAIVQAPAVVIFGMDALGDGDTSSWVAAIGALVLGIWLLVWLRSAPQQPQSARA